MKNVSVSIMRKSEVALLDNVLPDVFDYGLQPELVEEFLSDPRHHLAVAVAERDVVGFASALHYVHPDKPSELWINEVGVAGSFRGQKIATRLIKTLFAHGAGLGCEQAWVLTDEDNAAARSLYRSLGGGESAAVMYSFSTR